MSSVDQEQASLYDGAPLQIGDEVPNFTADSHLGMITFHEVLDGQFSVLVTFPNDFEAVATTELGAMAKLKEEFDARNVKLFALSADTKGNHKKWLEDVEELQDCKITFPLFADVDGAISRVFGLVRPGTVGNASKSVINAGLIVIVDIDKRIRFISQYPSSTGRNFYEVLRVIDTLQLTLFHSVSAPANWMQGEEMFVRNDVSNVAANSMFPKGFVPIKEWFRITPQPDTKN
ncbi:hypothetical protein TrCOL_g1127 [Triparma columacea]|uniref:Thioredoxin domain-containing protein n=1 Tax=Triparma columacea TaxID=722753 RepID=A0A9W7G986_9STRA|nr:hypothetical protein TrCOL_g1127 [Triparma columacea]